MSVTLPTQAGLARRLAYGEYVRQNHLNRLIITGQRITDLTGQRRQFVTGQNIYRSNGLRHVLTSTESLASYEELIELENVKIGLKIEDINKNSYVYTKGKKLVLHINLCIICQDYFQSDHDIIREMNCGHPYHLHCIDKWFENNIFCPICKHHFN